MSFLKELCDLANTAPELGDPEDDVHEETKARVLENFDEDYEDVGVGKIRKHQPLPISDPEYVGKKTSWKELQKSQFSSSESESSDEVSELEDEEPQTSRLSASESNEVSSEGERDVEDEMDEGDEEISDDSDIEGEGDENDDDEVDDRETEEDGYGSEEEIMEGNETLNDQRELQDDDVVQKFSAVDLSGEIEKGKAVQAQLQLWDSLLELRIQLQKLVVTANRFPRPDHYMEFKRGLISQDQKQRQIVAAVPKAVESIFHGLLDLQDQMVKINPEVNSNLGSSKQGRKGQLPGSDDDEIPSDTEDEAEGAEREEGKSGNEEEVQEVPKKKRRIGDTIKRVASFHENFLPFRNATIDKWYERTRLATGKIGKGFTAFEQSPMKQIEHILADEQRLILRTQTKRSSYKVLGEKDNNSNVEGDDVENRVDEEVFDDDDFYHHLLREVIERKTANIDNPVALSRQWLEIQKLRSKVKKKVDTKASKGRRMRYEPIPKLANFMAPVDTSTFSDEARSELFSSLFGQKTYTVGV